MLYTAHKLYKLGHNCELNSYTLNTLIDIFNKQIDKKSGTILTGRKPVIEVNIPDLGHLVIKKYFRGGLVSYFNKDRYFFAKKSRSELEFDFLLKAEKAGVNVPEPIAFANKGKIFYQTWLVLKKIKGAQNFIELCLKEKKKAIGLLPAICKNINLLILNSIFHRDLHPGNIVMDNMDRPFIIDFDKACYFSGTQKELIKKYKNRWQRSVKKYDLPHELLMLELS
jgi:3-deoxy-D-manno-octulosonic acid kinase